MKALLKPLVAFDQTPSLTESELDAIVDRCGTNLNLACAIAWETKAAKAASMISFTADGASFDREQYITNANQMARMYRNRLNATIRLGT